MNKKPLAVALAAAMALSGCNLVPDFEGMNPFADDTPNTAQDTTAESDITSGQVSEDMFTKVLPNYEVLDPLYALRSIGDFNKGLIAYQNKQFTEALSHWYPLAKDNDPQAQYYIGVMYLQGQGLTLDYEQARAWLEQSASAGFIEAQYELGSQYLSGVRFEKNVELGVRWLFSAARKGHTAAQFAVGLLYQENSIPMSANLMAVYQGEQSEEANLKQAFKWYESAVLQNHGAAMNNLAWLYLHGKGVEKNEAQAFDLYQRAAKLGVVDAQYNLALLLEHGKGAQIDLQNALFWLSKAASNGHLKAQQHLPQLQKRIEFLDSSLVLYGLTLSQTTRVEMRDKLVNSGALKIREEDNYWFDIYESSQLLKGTDRVFTGYSLKTNQLASIEYRFPAHNDPSKVLDVIELIKDKYGAPIKATGEISYGKIHYQWQVKDTLINVIRYWPDTSVYLSYHIADRYDQMRQEMPESAEIEKLNLKFETY